MPSNQAWEGASRLETPLPAHAARARTQPTKQLAERAVLGADGDGLRTCALRPNGIWGPSLACMTIVKTVQMLQLAGGNFFSIAPDKRTDWTHVDNLVQAHILAADKLLSGGSGASSVGGKAYFVSDDEAVNTFAFVEPVVRAVGMRNWPVVPVPTCMLYASSWLGEVVCAGLRRLPGGCCRRARPPMTLLEARKVALSNHFSCRRARRDLGYAPRSSAELWPETAAFFAREFGPLPPVTRPPVPISVAIAIGMIFVSYAAFSGDDEAVRLSQKIVSLAFPSTGGQHMTADEFASVVLFRRIFVPMVFVHCVEAFGAALLASQKGLRVGGWALQTALLGYPSLVRAPGLGRREWHRPPSGSSQRFLTERRLVDGLFVLLIVVGTFLTFGFLA